MHLIKKSKIHIISIGGSIMHDLAINLKINKHQVSGSDDIIYDPSKSNLKKHNLLPRKYGYYKSNISKDLNFVITGMHTKKNNIELLEAKNNKIPIYSYPEFIRKFSENKHRIVIAGSHGKTTVTSIIMHVLKFNKIKFDYLVGAKVNGFKSNIKLSKNPLIIIEGDEYLSSPLDNKPKFLNYRHHIVLINGIEWDHFNVFNSIKKYKKQFIDLVKLTPKGGEIIYYEKDNNINEILRKHSNKETILKPFNEEEFKIINNHSIIKDENGNDIKLKIFGRHNMQNIAGAKLVCEQIGINKKKFYKAMQSYILPDKRLEIIYDNKIKIFRDFAHSPSKLKSTVNAVKNQYSKNLLVIYELYSSSSFSTEFLATYKDTLKNSDTSIIYFSEKIIKKRKFKKISQVEIRKIFNTNKIFLVNNITSLETLLKNKIYRNHNKLFMSSGNFDGYKIEKNK